MEFVCFVRISEQTASFAVHSIKRLVFITEVESVYCAVRTESLYNTDTGLSNWGSFHTSLNDLFGRCVNNYSSRPEHLNFRCPLKGRNTVYNLSCPGLKIPLVTDYSNDLQHSFLLPGLERRVFVQIEYHVRLVSKFCLPWELRTFTHHFEKKTGSKVFLMIVSIPQ